MNVSLIPYGQLANGNYGILLDNTTKKPIAAAIEVLTTLPLTSDAANFTGRTVFIPATRGLYVFQSDVSWMKLDDSSVTVGAYGGTIPTSPTPSQGALVYDLDDETLSLWDGIAWVRVGGRYASTFVYQSYTGNGVLTSYALGSTSGPDAEYVEAFLDGVRQEPYTDYVTVGNNIVFSQPPANGVKVFLRTMDTLSALPNAQLNETSFTATAAQTTFTLPVWGASPDGVMVFVNGLLKRRSADFTLQQQNTVITSISKTDLVTARLITVAAHNVNIGDNVTIYGGNSPYFNNATYTVVGVPNGTTIDVTVPSAAPASATGTPTMYYGPAYQNDSVVFNTPLTGGEVVVIKAISRMRTPGTGEANELQSVGGGTSLTAGKTGVYLRIKTLEATGNVTLIDTGTTIQIGSSNSELYEDRVSINVTSYIVTGVGSYLGVRNTSSPVSIDLGGVPNNSGSSGRKITIVDESGAASGNNITIYAGGSSLINGASSYVINQNYGYVTLVKDGQNWFIIGRP